MTQDTNNWEEDLMETVFGTGIANKRIMIEKVRTLLQRQRKETIQECIKRLDGISGYGTGNLFPKSRIIESFKALIANH